MFSKRQVFVLDSAKPSVRFVHVSVFAIIDSWPVKH